MARSRIAGSAWGSIVTGWNPASHNAYWTDRDFYKQAGGMIRQALAIAEA